MIAVTVMLLPLTSLVMICDTSLFLLCLLLTEDNCVIIRGVTSVTSFDVKVKY